MISCLLKFSDKVLHKSVVYFYFTKIKYTGTVSKGMCLVAHTKTYQICQRPLVDPGLLDCHRMPWRVWAHCPLSFFFCHLSGFFCPSCPAVSPPASPSVPAFPLPPSHHCPSWIHNSVQAWRLEQKAESAIFTLRWRTKIGLESRYISQNYRKQQLAISFTCFHINWFMTKNISYLDIWSLCVMHTIWLLVLLRLLHLCFLRWRVFARLLNLFYFSNQLWRQN